MYWIMSPLRTLILNSDTSTALCVRMCRYILKSKKYSIRDNHKNNFNDINRRDARTPRYTRLIWHRSALLNFKNIQNHRCYFYHEHALSGRFAVTARKRPHLSYPRNKHVRARKVCWADLYARVNLIPLTPITVGRIPSHGGMTFLRYTHVTRRWFAQNQIQGKIFGAERIFVS